MAKRQTKKVIHFGAKELPIAPLLSDEFQYIWQTDMLEPPVKDQPLFKLSAFNRYYQDALFLIDASSPWVDLPEVLTALPANQILCDQDVKLSAEFEQILALKGTHRFDFGNPALLAKQINADFFGRPNGSRLLTEDFTIAPSFPGEVRQFGRVHHEIKFSLDNQWHLAVYPGYAQFVPANTQVTVSVEYERLDDNTHIKVVVNQFDIQSGDLVQSQEQVDGDLKQGIQVAGGNRGHNMQLLVFVSGAGTIRLGSFHIRRLRGSFGEIMLNSWRLRNLETVNADLGVYFDAGDLKPPLNVYFGGWHTAENFEGNRMMQGLNAPFLLFTDLRLDGGAFYLGSSGFEQQVVATIKETLARLHFKPSDLILSGLSMGTFAAMYYGAQLAPSGIVVGKPLVNLGNIAVGSKLTRPEGFDTSLDMLLLFEGNLNRVKEMNKRFWRVFKTGDFSHTTFVFAYMLNDDYDPDAFPDVRRFLKEADPTARILSKGLVGRHNDDTPGIVNWFLMQYHHLLQQQFARHFD